MADLPPLADQVRAHLRGGAPTCEALCGAAWQVDVRTVLRWPLGASGSTADSVVPLGPTFALEIASDGVAIRCGEARADALPAACPGVPPIDPARVGFFVDPARPLGDLATDAQRGSALWLRDDGTSVRLEPGWTVAFGRWHAEAGAIVLAEGPVVRGVGGGSDGDQVLGSLCVVARGGEVRVPTATLDGWARAAAPALDERFYRRGCAPE